MAGGATVMTGPSTGKNPLRHGFIKREHLWPFILVTTLFFLWGFAYGLLDVLNKDFQNNLHITKLESTGLQVAYFGGGYFCFSPVSAQVMKKYGYKVTIIMGLTLYSLGAILFWPVAHQTLNDSFNAKAIFGGFVVCTLVIACGLATLEVAANSFITVLPDRAPEIASFRLNFSQSWNGVASFVGPLIASKFFFAKGVTGLKNVQFVYLAVFGLGVLIIVAFVLTKLPDISEEDLALEAEEAAASAVLAGTSTENVGFWRTKAPFGFITQFCYVGAQVTIGSFFLNLSYESAHLPDETGSQYLSYGLILFTVGRFFGTSLLSIIDAPFLLGIYALICMALALIIGSAGGMASVGACMAIMFFESIMYPLIFVLGTNNLGRHTRRAAGLLVMGVAGGAVLPPIQGAIADNHGTRVSYYVVVPLFAEIAVFAFLQWRKAGFKVRANKAQPMGVSKPEEEGTASPAYLEDSKPSSDKNEIDYVESVHRS